MNSRTTRPGATHSGSALIHRGPQAFSAPHAGTASYAPPMHAPNAALLIDFDNVTMGIRSDLGKELRTLLGSDIIKGKVAVQRAYADWRRYPQYVVPLAESSIDMIMAPAYGTSKKNATDIRLAVDAMELVFTRPEIGTYILLSGDSDFASLVTKLKEYGKYVIGVGIKESSSDLLVMNCDEYYSYTALAGLVKTTGEEPAKKWDAWELVTEAVNRMKRNGDVMRSDRLKQVMQDIDSTFDEKDLGMSKFSRFVQDAVHRGLLSANKLENGQLEIGLPTGAVDEARAAENTAAEDAARADAAAPPSTLAEDRKSSSNRSRRGRRGRGRDRDDRPRMDRPLELGVDAAEPAGEMEGDEPSIAAELPVAPPSMPVVSIDASPAPAPAPRPPRETRPQPAPAAPKAEIAETIGISGERLTRDEAFDLLRRTVGELITGNAAVRTGVVRAKARDLLGRDSESLSDRNFPRILKDAHDHDVIDLRRRGDDFEIARVADVKSVADQLVTTAAANAPAATVAPPAPRGMGHRGVSGPRGRGGRPGTPPADLLSIGVVKAALSASSPVAPVAAAPASDGSSTPAQVSQASPAAVVEPPMMAETPAVDVVPSVDAAPAVDQAPGNGAITVAEAQSAVQQPLTGAAAASVPATRTPARQTDTSRGSASPGGQSRPSSKTAAKKSAAKKGAAKAAPAKAAPAKVAPSKVAAKAAAPGSARKQPAKQAAAKKSARKST